jgi:hypothetical protein
MSLGLCACGGKARAGQRDCLACHREAVRESRARRVSVKLEELCPVCEERMARWLERRARRPGHEVEAGQSGGAEARASLCAEVSGRESSRVSFGVAARPPFRIVPAHFLESAWERRWTWSRTRALAKRRL